MALKDITDNELVNCRAQDLADKYFYQIGSIRGEISRRGLVNIHSLPKEINVSLGEFKDYTIKDLCVRYGVTRPRLFSYALEKHNITREDIKRFRKERELKRADLSHVSDEELRKPVLYLMKTHGITQTSVRCEREKRGIVILPQAPFSAIVKKISNEELFSTKTMILSNKYGVGVDTVYRERRRRQEKDNTLKTTTRAKRKLEHIPTKELFSLSIAETCEKYNVGKTTVTMERRRR